MNNKEFFEWVIDTHNSGHAGWESGFTINDGDINFTDFANTYSVVAALLTCHPLGRGANIAAAAMQGGTLLEEYGRTGDLGQDARFKIAGAAIAGAMTVAVLLGAPWWLGVAGALVAMGMDYSDVQEALLGIHDALSDPAFYDALTDEAKALIDDMNDSFDEAMEAIEENFTELSEVMLDAGFWSSFFYYSTNLGEIYPAVSDYYAKAGTIFPRKDPLALDLNNDGITTLPSTDGIIFDHNGSGTKYGTGWINEDDGWLALDRNNNNAIDSGRELFGDNTIKLNGNKATDAYDALASFNTNNVGNSANKIDLADATGDTDNDGVMEAGETYWDMNRNGVFDAGTDKTFADLRVWVDANSNAETDPDELQSLADLHIVSISTGKTSGSGVDINGNNNTFKGDYTKVNGGVAEVIGDGARAFNLAENKAFREFADVDAATLASDVFKAAA